jgi:pimeloyl-ACP methyl ester carboxylesterase
MDASVTVAQTKPRAEAMRTMFGALTPAAFAAQNRAALATMITDPKNVDAVAATSSKSDAKAVAEAVYELMTTDLRPLLATARDQLAAYIRAHRLAHPIVVGHSLGGFLALWLAAHDPELVGGVVVVDALPFLPAAMDPKATVATMKPRAAQMRAMLAAFTPEAFARQNRVALAGMITDPKQADAVAARSRRSDPKTVADAMYEMMVTDLRPSLGNVRAPTLVLAAGADPGADPASVRAAFEAQYAGLRGHTLVVAKKARHFIMLDDPGFFFGQLDAFFARLAKGA